MPIVPFDSLPEESRVWIFASEHPLDGDAAQRLLEATDEFLDRWKAHGEPLRAARQWSDDRFLAVGVDPRTTNASGCSIDGLFRAFRALEPIIGTRLMAGGRVHYRDADGLTHAVSRDEFSILSANGVVNRETMVFDTSLTSAGEFRRAFERPAGETWVGALFEHR